MQTKKQKVEPPPGSFFGSVANFFTSTTSTADEMLSGAVSSNRVTIYKCGNCGQQIAKYQKKCYNCRANINWAGIL